jgi:hypothetical protein
MKRGNVVNKIERYYKKKWNIKKILVEIDDKFESVVLFALNKFIKKNSKMFRWFLKKVYKRWVKKTSFMRGIYRDIYMSINRENMVGWFGEKRCVWMDERFVFYLGRMIRYYHSFGYNMNCDVELLKYINKEIDRLYLTNNKKKFIFEI